MLDWRKHIEAQERSGKSVARYCAEAGISDNRFYYWKKRLGAGEAFVPIGGRSGQELIIAIGERYRVTVPGNFDSAALKRVLELLDA